MAIIVGGIRNVKRRSGGIVKFRYSGMRGNYSTGEQGWVGAKRTPIYGTYPHFTFSHSTPLHKSAQYERTRSVQFDIW